LDLPDYLTRLMMGHFQSGIKRFSAHYGQRGDQRSRLPIGSNREAFGGLVHLLLGHVLANFNIALFASVSASHRVAYECGERR